MKKTIIITIIVIFILTTVYFGYKKIKQLTAQTFDIEGITINDTSVSGLIKLPVVGGSGILSLIVSNFAKKGYSFDNINIEVYSLDGTLIAYQTAPLTEAVTIEPQINNIIDLPMQFKGSFFTQMYNQLKDKYSSVAEMVQFYLNTGHFGTDVIVKGFVMKNQNKINFNITKSV